ncbi:MAG: class I SAM-dependent methyltransferase [Flavobacterium sp.]
MSLHDIIVERIRKNGPLSFLDFMEMALYHPIFGYYNSSQDKIGASGDFYTSPYLSASFGAMIGRQIEEMWEILEKKPFKIVEYGAGTGILCHDILDYLKDNTSLYDNLTYCIIEKSSSMRKIEKKHLHEKVSWYNKIQDIPQINGCVLSNELVDNFSVHQVIMEDQLMEVFVDYKDNSFTEILKPAPQELIDYFSELNVKLPTGFRTEVNMEAIFWIKEVAQTLNRGYVITIDYGASSSELYNIRRSWGTLLCYNKHHNDTSPYQNIGEQDITTHTNFSALQHWGLKYGLEYSGIVNQANFLLALGIKEYNETALKSTPSNLKSITNEMMINYRLLVDMGLKFKVLIQEKNVPKNLLKGLQFLNLSKITLT